MAERVYPSGILRGEMSYAFNHLSEVLSPTPSVAVSVDDTYRFVRRELDEALKKNSLQPSVNVDEARGFAVVRLEEHLDPMTGAPLVPDRCNVCRAMEDILLAIDRLDNQVALSLPVLYRPGQDDDVRTLPDLAYQRVSPNSVLLRAGWTAQLVVVGPLVSIWKFWLLYCKDFCPDFSSMFCVVDFDLYRRSIPALLGPKGANAKAIKGECKCTLYIASQPREDDIIPCAIVGPITSITSCRQLITAFLDVKQSVVFSKPLAADADLVAAVADGSGDVRAHTAAGGRAAQLYGETKDSEVAPHGGDGGMVRGGGGGEEDLTKWSVDSVRAALRSKSLPAAVLEGWYQVNGFGLSQSDRRALVSAVMESQKTGPVPSAEDTSAAVDLVMILTKEPPHPQLLHDVLFFPNVENLKRLGDYIRCAKKSLCICVYQFTQEYLANTILDVVSTSNVNCRVICDRSAVDKKNNQIERLMSAGIECRTEVSITPEGSYPALLHNKFAIVDQQIVLTGSYNWTFQATERNRENILALNAPVVITSFQEEFDLLWSKCLRLEFRFTH